MRARPSPPPGGSTESFRWDRHFVTGLADVDDQHHHPVDVINQFGELLTGAEGVPFDAIEKVFGELAAYAQYHFSEEETLMDTAGVDPRHQDRHRLEHVNSLREVTQLHGAMAARKSGMERYEALIKAADDGVYAAKKNGRNRVAVAPS